MKRLTLAVALLAITSSVFAAEEKPAERKPPTPRSYAQFDPTGYWVSVITEDWRYRMQSAEVADADSIPLNAKGREQAKLWNPEKDAAAGEQCKAYGAIGIMRMPGRLHISWQDDTTLKLEFDNGSQIRLIRFADFVYPMGFTGDVPPRTLVTFRPDDIEPSLQGYSVAAWRKYFDGRGFAGAGTGGGLAVPRPGEGGTLMVVTSRLLPGYLRKNGIPYSADATLTEYFSLQKLPNGESWLVVTAVVEDPVYLYEPFITSTHFRREADGSRWNPGSCRPN